MDGLGIFKFILFLKIYLQPLTPDHLSQKGSDEMNKPKLKKMVWMTELISAVIFLWFLSLFTVTQAAGLVDDTVSEDNLYSLYPLDHYQLDFVVDSGWDWLPWNWDDGIGKQLNARTFHCPVNTVIPM